MILLPFITWWLLLQLFGLVGLPLAFRLLGNLPDRGYAFARPLGLLLTGYLLWLGGSLGFWQNGGGESSASSWRNIAAKAVLTWACSTVQPTSLSLKTSPPSA